MRRSTVFRTNYTCLVNRNYNLIIRSDEPGGKVPFRGFNYPLDKFNSFLDAKAVKPLQWTDEEAHYRPFTLQCKQLAKMGPRIPTQAYFNCNLTAPEHRN